MRSCGRFGPASEGSTADTSSSRVGEDRVRGSGRSPHALRLGVGLHQIGLRLGAAGELEIADGFRVDGEDAAGGAVFRSHVGDGRPIRQAEVVEAGTEEFDELSDHAELAKHLGRRQHQIGGGGAFLSRPVILKPTTSGISMVTGWPSMAASASMPPTPQPRTPRPLTMVVWLSVPTQVSE